MKCFILQDKDLGLQLQSQHFDPHYWVDKPGYQIVDSGRGGSIKISLGATKVILRPYYRGGLVRKLVADRYLWTGINRTRPWREWKVLNQAREAGLPVPEAIAVFVSKTGLCYRAAIMTRYLEDSLTLAARLADAILDPKSWYQLGLVLKRLQAQGIRHADLNASNILVDKLDRFYLIDFDRARVMKHLDDWQWGPLYRLQRSLDKFDRNHQLHYNPDDWQALMDGYQA